jgi:hypothetical protein
MTAELEGGEWSTARPGRNLTPGKIRCPFYRRLGGPQSRSGRAENLVPTGIFFFIWTHCSTWPLTSNELWDLPHLDLIIHHIYVDVRAPCNWRIRRRHASCTPHTQHDIFLGGHSIPDRPARRQSLYRLSYPAHWLMYIFLLLLLYVGRFPPFL